MTEIFDQDKEYIYGIFESGEQLMLVEVFPDGQMHVAFKSASEKCWTKGHWTVFKRAHMS